DKYRGHFFSDKLVEMLGPRRAGELIRDPYIHYAASVQKLYEQCTLSLVTHHLGDVLKDSGKLAFAGSGALNVKLNQRLAEMPQVKELFVPPSPGDAGTAIGAAAYAQAKRNIPVRGHKNAERGPRYSTERSRRACEKCRERAVTELLAKAAAKAASLLAEGHLVGWFQGRLEFGSRALGNRCILGNPNQDNLMELINKRIKFRENWRSFSPSIIDTLAEEVLQSTHPAPYMNMTFNMSEKWKERLPSVVYKDGSVRAHVATRRANPRFYALLKEFESRVGFGILLNTSLNRPGEPTICSPEDALDMFFGSDLEYLIMQDILVTKRPEPEWNIPVASE